MDPRTLHFDVLSVGRDLVGDPLERKIKEDKDVHEEPRILL